LRDSRELENLFLAWISRRKKKQDIFRAEKLIMLREWSFHLEKGVDILTCPENKCQRDECTSIVTFLPLHRRLVFLAYRFVTTFLRTILLLLIIRCSLLQMSNYRPDCINRTPNPNTILLPWS